jgi:hypothetical protein
MRNQSMRALQVVVAGAIAYGYLLAVLPLL